VKRGREGIHHSLRDSFPRIFGDDWERAREVYYKNFLECHIEEISILPQMTDMLNLLSSTDIYLAIVSNKTGKYLREEVEHLGLNHHFDKVVGATDAKADKPHPDPVHLALDGAGIAAGDDVWFIGDSMTDIECAVATNCVPVLFGDNVPMDDPEHVWPIDYAHVLHVKDHNELITLLKEIL
jgi:phosphoglycolate phosphatase